MRTLIRISATIALACLAIVATGRTPVPEPEPRPQSSACNLEPRISDLESRTEKLEGWIEALRFNDQVMHQDIEALTGYSHRH